MGRDERQYVLKRGASGLLVCPFVQAIEQQQNAPFVYSTIQQREQIGRERRLERLTDDLLQASCPLQCRA